MAHIYIYCTSTNSNNVCLCLHILCSVFIYDFMAKHICPIDMFFENIAFSYTKSKESMALLEKFTLISNNVNVMHVCWRWNLNAKFKKKTIIEMYWFPKIKYYFSTIVFFKKKKSLNISNGSTFRSTVKCSSRKKNHSISFHLRLKYESQERLFILKKKTFEFVSI